MQRRSWILGMVALVAAGGAVLGACSGDEAPSAPAPRELDPSGFLLSFESAVCEAALRCADDQRPDVAGCGFALTPTDVEECQALLRSRATAIGGAFSAGDLCFFGAPTGDPSVHAWMPAAGIFFRDPDGNSLELVAMLGDSPRPDLSVLPLSEWRALRD